jgi:predicted DNA-binding protein with PD1-like motif
MRSRLLAEHGGTTHILVFDKGDEVVGELEAFAREHDLTAASFTGIGAFSRVTLGYFDWETKEYLEIPLEEQVEVLTLAGDIALKDGEPAVHAHVVIGGRDGRASGGHLLEAEVRPTLEVVLSQAPEALQKRFDPETGLALIDPDAG